MNHLLTKHQLRNRYYGLRHGYSFSNLRGIIVSDIRRDNPDFGLTPLGKQQVEKTIAEQILEQPIKIYTSDFSRARQSAAIAANALEVTDTQFTPALRERFFGDWEGTSHAHFIGLREADLENPYHPTHLVESIAAVMTRTTQLIIDLEQQYNDTSILLVSHGDPLDILQLAFLKLNPDMLHRLPGFANAELRRFHLAEHQPTSL